MSYLTVGSELILWLLSGINKKELQCGENLFYGFYYFHLIITHLLISEFWEKVTVISFNELQKDKKIYKV